MNQREQQIRKWFDMWLTRTDTGIVDLFAPDALYIESWGPEYRGAEKIRHWFEEWNTRGTVLRWASSNSSTGKTRRWLNGPLKTPCTMERWKPLTACR